MENLSVLKNVIDLGCQMEKPRDIHVKLSRSDFNLLCDYVVHEGISMEVFVRGIILSFLSMYGDTMKAASGTPSEEVADHA